MLRGQQRILPVRDFISCILLEMKCTGRSSQHKKVQGCGDLDESQSRLNNLVVINPARLCSPKQAAVLLVSLPGRSQLFLLSEASLVCENQK